MIDEAMPHSNTEKSPGPSHSQDALSLQISLPQMLDLALGSPEVGAVNLNILHNFLHVLLHQVSLHSTKVEYRGNEANRIRGVMENAPKFPGPSLQLHEYSITDGSSKKVQRKRSGEGESGANVYMAEETDGGRPSSKGRSGKGEKVPSSAPVSARGNDQADVSSVAKKTKGSRQQILAGSRGEPESVIFVEPIIDGVPPTALGFKKLEDSLQKLRDKFESLDEIANNPEMIERMKVNKSDPLSDMWHIINMNKRLDGCEKGIEKLSSMLNDLIKSDKIEIKSGVDIDVERYNDRIVELENQLLYLSEDLANLRNLQGVDDGENIHRENPVTPRQPITEMSPDTTKSTVQNRTSSEEKLEEAADLKESGNADKIDADHRSDAQSDVKSSTVQKKSSPTNVAPKATPPEATKEKNRPPSVRRSVMVDLSELKKDVGSLKNDMTELQKNVKELNSKLVEFGEKPSTIGHPDPPVGEKMKIAVASESTVKIQPKVAKSAGTVSAGEEKPEVASLASSKAQNRSKSTIALDERIEVETAQISARSSGQALDERSKVTSFGALESRTGELEKQIGWLKEKLGLGVDGRGGVADLVTKVEAIQAELENMKEATSQLVEEKGNREIHTTALVEQIELLKTIKADKEDLEDALADKADAQTVNRKVSHDQFDAACDDLSRGLEDTIAKLGQQESVWQQALDEVQREIEGKLDKMEISPLKDFVNNRLKILQEKLKTLAEMRRVNEAAGTKKMLSDVQCISCDANVVMRMEESSPYRAPTMTATKSIKPYLTYELDQIRKQQRQLPSSRNMIQFEAMMQEMTRKSKPIKDELTKSPREHLCNRYCGGSHTITTPQQRVMRVGHYLEQWGPNVIQLTEGVVKGNDGQLYRSRPMPGKGDTDGPESNNEKTEKPPPTPPSPSVTDYGRFSQRQSRVTSRIRSVGSSQAQKRSSTRKLSEASKGMVAEVKEDIPTEPKVSNVTEPTGTTVEGEADVTPETQGGSMTKVAGETVPEDQGNEE